MRRALWTVSFLAAASLLSCFPKRPAVAPLPPVVHAMEGYASFRLTREGKAAKSRLSFVFVLPDRGRVEVIDPLGRTASVLFFDGAQAYLVLPRRRAYWKADRDEAMTRLLGFALSPEEVTLILTGRAGRLGDWVLERDGRGRVVRGGRADLRFEVRLFFEPDPLPRLLVLSRNGTSGSLRILQLSFNPPLRANPFRHFFLEDEAYKPATWEEVEKWLGEESRG